MPEYSIGKRLKLFERVGRVINARTEAGRKIRLKTEDAVVKITPTWESDNIGAGTIAGAMIAAVSTVLDDYAIPLGSETEIVDVDAASNGGVKYTVNVNSAFQNQARFKAMIESGTGFTSLLTDKFNVQTEDVLKERPARDTWQYEVVVEDANPGDSMERGLGLLNS